MKYYLLLTQEGERIMKNNESDLPTGLAKPAQRALAGAGYL
ncbi:hypothetical protein [Peribacillus sp. R9-11]|nr:hypothetical protein [Peribacillus sp. R9-11]WMX54845.1 hypothetical protein RE409_22735 [Peribacillus sp. R9-11]